METRLDIQHLAREFAQQTIAPQVEHLEANPLDLRQLWPQLGDMGFCGLQFPEQYGGLGLDNQTYLAVIEEFAKVSASLAVALSVHTTVGILPIATFGNADQKQRYLPDLLSGKTIAAFGLTEPDAGSDAGSGNTKAVPEGDGYRLNGEKIFITNAHLADVIVTTARSESGVSGAKGLSAFIVDKPSEGLTVTDGDEKMGLKGSDWGNLVFEEVWVPAANRLGEAGLGFKIFMNSLDAGRVSIAAISVGIAQACLEACIAYAQERQQFGTVLGQFQAIQFKLADMATPIQAARLLVQHAGRLKDAGRSYTAEASQAKLFATEMVQQVAEQAIQIFGGYGYTKAFPVERYFRDARCMSLVEGTSQIQRLVIARQLLSATIK